MTDITIEDHGSIVILRPHTPAAVEWIDEHIGADNGYQPHYPAVVIGHHYADNVIDGMVNDGLEVL